MHYPVEQFTAEERERLAPHFTNLDAPVFALVNLPETVKGALFARYSRYRGTLRRLFLDEFADTIPVRKALEADEGSRARELYERIFLGYGDDSVAQVGGAHVACEWASNLLTKILQRHRLAAYLEQSTRYITFDEPVPGLGFRYYRAPEFGHAFEKTMDSLFITYRQGVARLTAWATTAFPRDSAETDRAHERAVRAKALDAVRGLLPAASLSHVGVYASGQTYEHLLLHLIAHPLAEAREFGAMLLAELEKVIPSFVARVPRPDRGGRWVAYLRNREARTAEVAERLGLRSRDDESPPLVRLLAVGGDEDRVLAALVYEHSRRSEAEAIEIVRALTPTARTELLKRLASGRDNRRHRPGRGLEALRYRFEVVSDYGAFRDLQRHRILTAQWQPLSPDLGAEIPREVELAGFSGEYERALDASRGEYERLRAAGHADEAPYALCLAFRIRYALDLNAREAMHVIELRSGREGHPAYRAVVQEMHRLIREVHPTVADAMCFVDLSREERLERLPAELRIERRTS